MVREDTVRKRYFFKLLSNIITLSVGIISITIVPRTLGPASYGDYSFLLSSLMAILVFMEVNTSLAFFTYASRENITNPNESFFFFFFFIINALFLSGIALAVILKVNHLIWPGQIAHNLLLMSFLVSLVWMSQIIIGYGDSKALTVIVEKINIAVKLATFSIIITLFIIKKLNLNSYILTYIISVTSTIIFSIFWFNKKISIIKIFTIKNLNFNFFWDYWRRYCGPLFLYNIFGFIVIFFDRWILQIVSGSIQQGYYSLAFQMGTIINTLVISVTPIYRREIAKSNFQNNIDTIKNKFIKYMKLFYIFSTFLSVMIIFQSHTILKIVGSKFAGSLIPFIILCFYPMYQTYGHLCGEIFLATERTKIYTKLGMFTNSIGLLAAYFIMAPRSFFIPGLEMGSIGLALKMVIINIFHVHVLLFFVCKLLNLKFTDFIIHQIKVLSILFAFGIISISFINQLPLQSNILKSSIFCLIFFIFMTILLLKKPSIIGIEKEFVYSIFQKNKSFVSFIGK